MLSGNQPDAYGMVIGADGQSRQMGSVFDQGASPYNPYGGGANPGGFSPSPNYPGGSYTQPSFNEMWGNTPYIAGNGYSLPDMITRGYTQSPAAMFNSRFSAAPGGGESPNYTAFGGMYGSPAEIPGLYSPGMRMAPMPSIGGAGGDGAWRPAQPMAGDIGFSRQPSYPNLGYNSSFSSLFAQQPANAYAALYGAMQFPNSGTPSQYYTGDRYGGGQLGMTGMLPPGFATPYSADNQGGALGWSDTDANGQRHYQGALP
jgi:hypothetical protein